MKGRIVFGKDKAHYFLDSEEVLETEFRAAFPDKEMATDDGDTALSAVPLMRSEALAVSPHRIQHAMADAKKHGVPTNFDEHGRPLFVSQDHQRRYCQIYGFVNKDSNWSGKNYGVRPKTNEELAAELFDG